MTGRCCAVAVSGEAVCNAEEVSSSLLETERCTDEDPDGADRLVSMSDSDCDDSIAKQRRYRSSALLKKEQKHSSASPDVFVKVCVNCLAAALSGAAWGKLITHMCL